MGRRGNEKPLSLLFFSFFSLSLSLFSNSLLWDWKRCDCVCTCPGVWAHLCIYKTVVQTRTPPPSPASPSLSRLLYSFFTSNFIFSSVWEEGGYRGADSIRFHDWAAGIQEGHGKVKEFSGTNMIMALYHLIRSKVCHSKVEPLCSCTGTTGPARVWCESCFTCWSSRFFYWMVVACLECWI